MTAFLLSRSSTPENGVQALAGKSAATANISSPLNSSEAISPEIFSAQANAIRTGSSPLYRFETAIVAGKPAAIPARFATPSAAEATTRSARLTELLEGSLSALRQGDTIRLPLPDNRFVMAHVNVVQREADGQVLVGGYLAGDIKGSFSLGEDDSRLGGTIIPTEGKVAYQIETGRDGAAYLLEKNKGSVVCMELPVMVVSRAVVREAQRGAIAESFVIPGGTGTVAAAAAPEYLLSSRPTAPAVAYLDFDGETVTDSLWNSGNAINASSSGLSADQITEVWRRVSEDYRPFNIDVTTNRARYDNAPAGSRMRCVITQNNGWYGSAGGVAYIGSWSSAGGGGMSSTIPCWVFSNLLSLNTRYVAEAVSHEIGHTLGLSHDGLNDGGGTFLQSYYSGHGSGATGWAPIMGSGYYSSVVQWSAGNYSTNGNVGNNTENDLGIISDASNHAGYMSDDAGNTRGAASALRFSSGSTVSTIGLAERTGDVDVYSFTTSGGGVTFTLVPEFSGMTGQPNLDARATLYDSSGNTLADSNPSGSLFPSIATTLGSGTYYIAITAVGEGAVPGTGYTNYGSLGRYEITGTVVSSVALPPSITSANAASGVTGSSFSFQVTASNSPTAYSASGLPSGLGIDSGSGLISGTVSSSASAGVYSVTLTATNSSGSGTQSFALTLTNPLPSAPVITSGSTGSVVRGSSFSHQIVATNSATSYGASGLPSGLSINTGNGFISGTVSSGVSAAVYSVSLTATNAGGTGTQTFALTVTNPLPSAPVITSASSASAVIGAAFSHQVVASNSPTSYAASGLPTGLSINSSNGYISGTVSSSLSATVASVTIVATNAGGSGSQTFLLTLSNPLPSVPVITGSTSGSVVSGGFFSFQIVATNSPTSYNASGLPSGLVINPGTGLIYGTVSTSVAAGTYSITLTASNAGGSGTQTLSLTVTNSLPPAPIITSLSTGSAVIGAAFIHQVVASSSPTSYTASGLPAGLSINSSTGLISGTVSSSATAGSHAVTIVATNAGGSGSQTFSLTLTNPLPFVPAITGGMFGSVVSGGFFSFQIVATNSPTSFNATGLLAGLVINPGTGLIYGNVSTSVPAGTYSITLTASNAGGSGTQTLLLTVTNPLPSAPLITSLGAGSAVIGSAFNHQVTATNSPTSYAASGLPAGLTINSSNGLISGTVSSSLSAGVASVNIVVINAGGSGSQTFLLTLTHPIPSAPVITSAATASVLRGASFSYQIAASNSPTSYNASGLPSGLSINTSTGLISGTVSSSASAGIYSVTLTATNAGGSGTRLLAITVTVPAVSVPVITSAASARLVLGVEFGFQVVATNSPTSFVAVGLPPGMSIDSVSGRISGSPPIAMTSGVYTVSITAANASGSTNQSFALELKSAYAAWAQDKQIGDITTASTADPDGDGMGNLLEYAFDLSPSSADTVAVTQVTVANVSGTRRMEISFIRPLNRPDLVYTVEVSSNMVNWTAGHAYGINATNGSGLPTQEMERTSLGLAGERIRVRDIGGVGQRFIRVKVTTF